MNAIHPDFPLYLALTGVLAICSVTDLKDMRIPNIITFPAMILALAYHGMTNGLDGLAFSALGLAVGLGVMLVPFLMGLMGAGDAKLMAAAGAFLGPYMVLDAFLATSIIGGLYAVFVLAFRRDYLRRVFGALWNSLVFFMAFKRFNYVRQDNGAALPRLCYGVAIALGTVTAMVLSLHGYGLMAQAG